MRCKERTQVLLGRLERHILDEHLGAWRLGRLRIVRIVPTARELHRERVSVEHVPVHRALRRGRMLLVRESDKPIAHAQAPARVPRIRLGLHTRKHKAVECAECRRECLGRRRKVEVLDEERRPGGGSGSAAAAAVKQLRARFGRLHTRPGLDCRVLIGATCGGEERRGRLLEVQDRVLEALVRKRAERGARLADHRHLDDRDRARWRDKHAADIAMRREQRADLVASRAVRDVLNEDRVV